MTKTVVDALEEIDVGNREKGQGALVDRTPPFLGEFLGALPVRAPCRLSPEGFVESASVEQTRQFVAFAVVEKPEMVSIDPKHAEHQPLFVLTQRGAANDVHQADHVPQADDGKDVSDRAAPGARAANIHPRVVTRAQGRLGVQRQQLTLRASTAARRSFRRGQFEALAQPNAALTVDDPPENQTPGARQLESHRRERGLQLVLVARIREIANRFDKVRHLRFVQRRPCPKLGRSNGHTGAREDAVA